MKSAMNRVLSLLILVVTILLFMVVAEEGSGKIITVDDDGGADYTRILDAIDNATEGDTIRVWSGVYREEVVVNRSISLVGNGSEKSIIYENSSSDIGVKITADRVNFSGFMISGGWEYWVRYTTGISVESDYVHIFENNFTECRYGIDVHGFHNIVEKNTCWANEYGICLRGSKNTTISGNLCLNNTHGIQLTTTKADLSEDNTLANNSCIKNSFNGIEIIGSGSTVLINNNCSSNTISGITVRSSNKTTVQTNVISHNKWGVYLFHSNDNDFTHNTISNNEVGIFAKFGGQGNSFRYNAIVDNDRGIGEIDNSNYTIDAKKNYWGSDSGPHHPEKNPNGKGDWISDHVKFEPWLDEDGDSTYNQVDRWSRYLFIFFIIFVIVIVVKLLIYLSKPSKQ